MICLNCGKEAEQYLCNDCRKESVLESIWKQFYTKIDHCENEYIKAFAASFEEPYAYRNCVPEIIGLFDGEIAEYYWCRYYYCVKDPIFEEFALKYIDSHDRTEAKTQIIINLLLLHYGNNDFIKPAKWCEWIRNTEGLSKNLYYNAAVYYARIGDYDFASTLVDIAKKQCDDDNEKFMMDLDKLIIDIERYRIKKPYWPATEERRRAIAMFYDERGISYPRIESKPKTIFENEFEPIKECYELPKEYCSFWCAGVSVTESVRAIYQIAAIKIRNGEAVDEFQQYIRPFDGEAARIKAAKMAGVNIEVLESAEDVDQVMKKFFDFVGDDTLVSTQALGEQKKYIVRVARYSGMKAIENSLLDILDLAEDTAETFSNENYSRKYLLKFFNLKEGVDALSKARLNVEIIKCLENYHE